MKKLNNLKECISMCMTFGNLPTSYLESLTYEEQLIWFCKFLEETVIPAINENNDAVTELQSLFTQLQNHVDNYFNNLDVQVEINNKLESMAEDGSLYDIIKAYTDPIIEEQNRKIGTIESKVNTVASGSPAGVYSTLAALQQADPDHTRIYLVEADGEWYFWNSSTSQWKNGGVYQGQLVSTTDPEIVKLNNYHNDTIELFNSIEEGKIAKTFEAEEWGFLTHAGAVSGSGYQNSKHTDFIPIVPIEGTVLNCYARAIQNSVGVIILYDKDKNIITYVDGRYPNAYTADNYTLTIDNTHKDARYVRFSTYTTNGAANQNYSIVYNQIPYAVKEAIKELDTNLSLLDSFLKIGVIGDSLSVGWLAKKDGTYSDRNLKYSWPQYFARKHNIDVVNLGKSGITAKGWLTDTSCYPLAQQTQNKSQCYIIGLGVNDSAATYSGGWGSTSDIKTDYHNNPETFFGCYGGIIQRIKEINSDAVIFCLPTVGARESTEKNTYIAQIANYFGKNNNVHFINLTNYDYIYNDHKVQEYYVQGHYVAVGYNICSQIIDRAISRYMLDNSQYFKYTGWIEYNS